MVVFLNGKFLPEADAVVHLNDRGFLLGDGLFETTRVAHARPFRLDHTNLGKVYPGCLTEIMAVPWQADFRDCEGGVWWPSQRPDIAMTDPAKIPGSQASWENPIPEGDHQGMVDHVQQLGFIVPQEVAGEAVFVEQDRDPNFPREVPVA